MHNLIAVLMLAGATSYKPPVAMTAMVDPQMLQRRDAIAASLSPSARQKLHAIALSLANSRAITDGTVHSALTAAFGNLNGADIEALAFIVMMDATQSMQQDLKTIMDGVNDINKQKEALRTELSKSNQLKASVRAEEQRRYDELNKRSDSMQLKIQVLTSQMQNTQQMASNIMKSIHDSRSSVLRNLK